MRISSFRTLTVQLTFKRRRHHHISNASTSAFLRYDLLRYDTSQCYNVIVAVDIGEVGLIIASLVLCDDKDRRR